jgi:hypothetical protein
VLSSQVGVASMSHVFTAVEAAAGIVQQCHTVLYQSFYRSINSRSTTSSRKLSAPKFRPCRLGFMFRPILISASICQARRQVSWRYDRSLFLRAEATCNEHFQLRPKLVRTKLFIFLSAYTKFDPDPLKPGIGGMLFAFLATNITFV